MMADMEQIKICLVTLPYLIGRSWVRQDAEILRSLGFDVVTLPIPCGFPNPQCFIWLIKHARSILNCHIIFEWFAFPAIVFIGKALGKPTVLNSVGYEVALYPEFGYGLPSLRFERAMISLGFRNADYVMAISKESAKWAKTWGARKVSVIYEGIDTDKFKYKARKPKYRSRNKIVTVAYLGLMNVIRKDLITLLKALKLVVDVLPDAKLIIVGEKMDGYPVLVKTAKEVGIADAIVFKGFVNSEELLNIIYDASVFVMPSLQEGFPTALCEALSCGVPIVTTNRPAMNEVFENNVHALLVEAKNPQRLAEAITTILTHRDLTEVIAYNGRKLVETKYSKEVRAKNLKNFFLTVLNDIRKYNKCQGVNVIWLIIFIVLCVTSPLVIILHGLLNRFFKP
jgi:glycosyltransferase involved in cell wall biosynthesis